MTKIISKINIEDLVKKQDSISNAAIQNAVKQLQSQKEAEQTQKLVEQLEEVQLGTQRAVKKLRVIRAKEKLAKDYLQKVAEAELVFLQNANFDEYSETLRNASYILNKETDKLG